MNIFKKPAARFLAKRSALGLPAGFATIEIPQLWALNSAVECHLHTVEVTGSNPVAPTIIICLLHSHLRAAVYGPPDPSDLPPPRRKKVMPERPIRQPRFGHPGSRRVAGQRRRRGLSHLDSAS